MPVNFRGQEPTDPFRWWRAAMLVGDEAVDILRAAVVEPEPEIY